MHSTVVLDLSLRLVDLEDGVVIVIPVVEMLRLNPEVVSQWLVQLSPLCEDPIVEEHFPEEAMEEA